MPVTDAPSPTSAPRRAARAVAAVLRREAAGGMLLVAAAVVALIWANSPWEASYRSLLDTMVRVEVGGFSFEEDVTHVVNDALMALFFLVVGLEIKRELVVGELRDPRRVALPAFAALGGMVVPAAIFIALNAGGDGSRGWGVPMATDIAFALAVVALLGSRVPAPAKLVLLTLAIVDDIGAIAVIAVAYTDELDLRLVLAAVGIVALTVALQRTGVTYPPVYVIAGLALWLTVHESGVHATIAGVVMGLLTPASVCDRLIAALQPWTSLVIVPIFALVNAGIVLTTGVLADPSPVTVGVVAGLVVGKLVGVSAFGWLAVRTGLGRLPDGMRWGHLVGVAAVAGVGFTVSLFVTDLAYDDPLVTRDARVGVIVASVLAALLGSAVFAAVARRQRGVSSSRA